MNSFFVTQSAAIRHQVLKAFVVAALSAISAKAGAFQTYQWGWIGLTLTPDGIYKSQITATDSAQSVNIFQLSATATEPYSSVGFGLSLPWGLTVEYSPYGQRANHQIRGSQLTTQCFRIGFKTFCAGLTNTRDGDIGWDLKHKKFTLLKKAIDTETWNVYLGAGIDLLSGSMTLTSSDTRETASGATPLPFLAAGIDWHVGSKTYLINRIHHVDLTKRGANYKNTMLEVEIKQLITNNISTAIGIRDSLTEFEYSSSAQQSSLNWRGRSAYLKLTVGY